MNELSQWVIYERPKDFPEKFVVRRWVVHDGGELAADLDCKLARSLEEARSHVPPGLVRMPRSENDDPVIVETWI